MRNYIYGYQTKLLAGNVFAGVYHSVGRGVLHVTITHDAYSTHKPLLPPLPESSILRKTQMFPNKVIMAPIFPGLNRMF